jgi:hypothetical protein
MSALMAITLRLDDRLAAPGDDHLFTGERLALALPEGAMVARAGSSRSAFSNTSRWR